MEAEGRALRRAVARLGWSLALIGLTAGLAAAGAALCLWGLFQVLAPATGTAGAAFITGIIALIGAGGMTWVVKQTVR